MTTVDWIAVGVVALAAFFGLRRGLLASLLGLAGVVGGAILGARLAEHLIHGGRWQPYVSLLALAGAIVGGAVLASVGTMLGTSLRKSLFVMPPLRALDAAGGLVFGAVAGFALVWVIGIAALHAPGQTKTRDEAQRSAVVQRLLSLAPPATVLALLQRVDPLPSLPDLPGIATPDPPQPGVVQAGPIVRARRSLVRILGSACSLDVMGTGWAVAPQYVVTAAHVVRGVGVVTVVLPGGRKIPARAVVYDPGNDLAVLRVAGARLPALAITAPQDGQPVAVLGYPQSGALTVSAGRIGTTGVVRLGGAGFSGGRAVTSVRVDLQSGMSGAPVIDAGGAVHATLFGRSNGIEGLAYGFPSTLLAGRLKHAGRFVSTGTCG